MLDLWTAFCIDLSVSCRSVYCVLQWSFSCRFEFCVIFWNICLLQVCIVRSAVSGVLQTWILPYILRYMSPTGLYHAFSSEMCPAGLNVASYIEIYVSWRPVSYVLYWAVCLLQACFAFCSDLCHAGLNFALYFEIYVSYRSVSCVLQWAVSCRLEFCLIFWDICLLQACIVRSAVSYVLQAWMLRYILRYISPVGLYPTFCTELSVSCRPVFCVLQWAVSYRLEYCVTSIYWDIYLLQASILRCVFDLSVFCRPVYCVL